MRHGQAGVGQRQPAAAHQREVALPGGVQRLAHGRVHMRVGCGGQRAGPHAAQVQEVVHVADAQEEVGAQDELGVAAEAAVGGQVM